MCTFLFLLQHQLQSFRVSGQLLNLVPIEKNFALRCCAPTLEPLGMLAKERAFHQE